MASTYSPLKIELIATGEQSGTWGTTTNTNLGTALEEAITGSADVAFTSAADVTVTLTDTNTAQTARNLRLNITESGAGIGYAGNLILGSGCQIEKLYLINNTTTGAKTIKNTSGSGISVPAGKSMFVYNNGTNVVDATTYLSSLTLGSALPIASGGTGTNSTTFASLTTNVSGILPIANGGTGENSRQAALDALAGSVTSGQYLRGNGSDILMSAIQAGDVPTLNQNTSGTAAGLSATLAIGSGGTGQTTAAAAFDALNPMTTGGDLIYESTPGSATRLPVGSTGQVLTVAGGLPTWAAAGGGSSQIQIFTSPGTWTKPSSCTNVKVYVVGAGGGSPNTQPGGGPNSGNGGAGGYAAGYVPVSAPVSVTVGAGGTTPGPGGQAPGNPGGSSSFGPVASATGGAGGLTPGNGASGTGTISSGTAILTTSGNSGDLAGVLSLSSSQSSVPRSGGTWNSTTLAKLAGAGGSGGAIGQGYGGISGVVIVEFVG
jgi:hypothetical protein